MFASLLIVLVPLITGYLIPVKQKSRLLLVNQMLGTMVYLILFLMGLSLAFIDNLGTNLWRIFCYTAVFFLCIILANIIALMLLERKFPWHNSHLQHKQMPSRLHMILESLKLCGMIILGFLLGLTHWSWLSSTSLASQCALIILLMLVGIQLRNSGMSLRQLLLNRHGMITAYTVCCSALVGGLIGAWLLDLPLKTGLAFASTFGWYSLSSIMMTDAFGPVIGSAAFFNDLARELLAIITLPTLMRYSRCTALGLCGATSMDFTLPILQRSGGIEIVPAAIVQGFLLSLITPLLMALFVA